MGVKIIFPLIILSVALIWIIYLFVLQNHRSIVPDNSADAHRSVSDKKSFINENKFVKIELNIYIYDQDIIIFILEIKFHKIVTLKGMGLKDYNTYFILDSVSLFDVLLRLP